MKLVPVRALPTPRRDLTDTKATACVTASSRPASRPASRHLGGILDGGPGPLHVPRVEPRRPCGADRDATEGPGGGGGGYREALWTRAACSAIRDMRYGYPIDMDIVKCRHPTVSRDEPADQTDTLLVRGRPLCASYASPLRPLCAPHLSSARPWSTRGTRGAAGPPEAPEAPEAPLDQPHIACPRALTDRAGPASAARAVRRSHVGCVL